MRLCSSLFRTAIIAGSLLLPREAVAELTTPLFSSPWGPAPFELSLFSDVQWQHYSIPKCDPSTLHERSGWDSQFHTDLLLNLFGSWDLSLDAVVGFNDEGVDYRSSRLLVAHELSNQASGELISSRYGITMRYCSPAARRTLAYDAHGACEGSLFFSASSELKRTESSLLLWWSLFSLGRAERGNFWYDWSLATDFFSFYGYKLGLMMLSSHGYGKEPLLLEEFSGYGKIAYRTIDLFLSGSWRSDAGWVVSSSVGRRVHSKHALKHNLFFSLSINYPFGI